MHAENKADAWSNKETMNLSSCCSDTCAGLEECRVVVTVRDSLHFVGCTAVMPAGTVELGLSCVLLASVFMHQSLLWALNYSLGEKQQAHLAPQHTHWQ